jgi:hypothetical protein
MSEYSVKSNPDNSALSLLYTNARNNCITTCFTVNPSYPSFHTDYPDIKATLEATAYIVDSVQELLDVSFNTELDLSMTELKAVRLCLEDAGIISEGMTLLG